MNATKEGCIILLVGPSGSGKSTIANKLHNDFGLKVVQSYTTRPKRYPGETGHIFVSDIEFNKIKNKVAYTEFDEYRYCATAEQVEECDIYVIDPAGVRFFWSHYRGKKRVELVQLFVEQKVLRKRLEARGDSPLSIEHRLKQDPVIFGDILPGAHCLSGLNTDRAACMIKDIFDGGKK